MTEVAFNQAGSPTVEFSVPDMMCPDSCAVAAREILTSQPGVKEVLVDFDKKIAIVVIEEGAFEPAAALAALADRGFVHSQLKADEHAATDAAPAPPTVESKPAG